MDDLIFELNEVKFSYLDKFPALCGIDIDIKKGEKIAVIGANGSGKSTFLQILDALSFPNKGSVKFLGRELKEGSFDDPEFSDYFRKTVGMVFQNPDVQLFCPTVGEDIVFGPLQLGISRPEIKKRFEELTSLLNIKDLLDRQPHSLSIGEKRKVAIASTLMINPDVLLLDEPTAGLDPLTTRHIIDFLLQANAEGKTIITSTHDLHIVEEISDMVYVFSQEKRIAGSGTPEDILHNFRLLQDNNLVHIHKHRHDGKVHIHPHQHLDHHH
ncbi:MAG: ABC transporter ATP-binding protein [Candidatus Omnitrophota bacterium]|nr:energy-coupling factor ABC transporter ATP-binding protein [Candidatus Omnitrophota bacterium]MBU1929274.1 energy-coupling factor ABC transporter ATP-binding protein [Candidatus Omnitrophota bacterium]MBU2035296.1 energy-coupling factor ABC transporter ATP-binding protein [Candidatus Omnitrophota bacterium]